MDKSVEFWSNFVDEYLAKWDRYASVRSHPRKKFSLEGGNAPRYFFPPSKQLILLHPLVLALGEEVKQFILIQSFYKYSNDIEMTETEVVNPMATLIANDRLPISFDFKTRKIATSILTDESYHALVASDSTSQVKELSKIEPIALPVQTELSIAIKSIKKQMAPAYHLLFELVAVCIAENTLTKDLVFMQNDKEVNTVFQSIIKEHLLDEARHSIYFLHILKEAWRMMDDGSRFALTEIIPTFLSLYLGNTLQKKFDIKLLGSLNFTKAEAYQIVHDTHDGFQLTKNHPMIKNLLILFDRAGLLQDDNLQKRLVAQRLM